MKKQNGVALIATLLIMAAIMALGVGTLFLSNMNLRIAENSYTHAIARYNAEAGLEVAVAKLKQDYQAATPNQLPASLTLPSSPDSSTVTYEQVSYTPYTTGGLRTQARVVIVGTGPNNARYQTEALVGAVASALDTPPFLGGLVSEDVVDANGGPTLKNAQLHGNGGYELSGTTTLEKCDEVNVNCVELGVSEMPVTAAPDEDGYTCKATGKTSSLCTSGEPSNYSAAPVSLGDVKRQYEELRNGTQMSPSKFGVKSTDTLTSTAPITGCTHVATSTTTTEGNKTTAEPAKLLTGYPANSTVCVTGDAEIPDGANYSNIRVIVKGNATVAGEAAFDTVNLLSMNTLDLGGEVTMKDTRLFADEKVDLNGSVQYSGFATIASGGDINWTSKAEGIYNTASNEVGLALIAVKNFDASGNLKGKENSDWVNAAVMAGGRASINGGARVRGGIGSKGKLEIKGSSEIYGDATFTNTDLVQQTMQVAPLSRR